MNIHNICFHGEIRKMSFFYFNMWVFISAMALLTSIRNICFHGEIKIYFFFLIQTYVFMEK